MACVALLDGVTVIAIETKLIICTDKLRLSILKLTNEIQYSKTKFEFLTHFSWFCQKMMVWHIGNGNELFYVRLYVYMY